MNGAQLLKTLDGFLVLMSGPHAGVSELGGGLWYPRSQERDLGHP